MDWIHFGFCCSFSEKQHKLFHLFTITDVDLLQGCFSLFCLDTTANISPQLNVFITETLKMFRTCMLNFVLSGGRTVSTHWAMVLMLTISHPVLLWQTNVGFSILCYPVGREKQAFLYASSFTKKWDPVRISTIVTPLLFCPAKLRLHKLDCGDTCGEVCRPRCSAFSLGRTQCYNIIGAM